MTLPALLQLRAWDSDVAFSGSVFVIRVVARSPCSTFVRSVSPDTSLVTVEWISTRIAVLCEDSR
jgi:hypothetical protein